MKFIVSEELKDRVYRILSLADMGGLAERIENLKPIELAAEGEVSAIELLTFMNDTYKKYNGKSIKIYIQEVK